MSDINFLGNKKPGDGQDEKQKGKDDKKEKFIWSDPEKKAKGAKNSAFFFLPFINKKTPSSKNSAEAVDKKKIKESREEILNLIKHNKNPKPPRQEKGKNFLRVLGEKLKKESMAKDILIDYRRIFEQEKEHKNQAGKIFNATPTAENRPVQAFVSTLVPVPAKVAQSKIKKPKNDWFNRLLELFEKKIIALNDRKNKTDKIIKWPREEEIKPSPPAAGLEIKKSEEVEDEKILVQESLNKNEASRRVLETNLIKGELATFFDLRSKIIILLSAILMPILAAGVIYCGLILYQKTSQAKNSAQIKRFTELEQVIAGEEAGIKEIYLFADRLKTVSKVFKQHLYWTNFFKFLEDNTIKDVYFENFDGDTSGNYAMEAMANSYGAISDQVNVYKNNKKIISVEADGGSMATAGDTGGGLIKFTLNFSIDKKIFTE